MMACGKGHLEVAQILHGTTEGQDLEERDNEGQTALQWAASGGHKDVVAFLLSKGAQARSRDNSGLTPFMSACGSEEECGVECSSLFKVKAIPNLGREPLRETIRTVPTKS
jgi:hypothetical protein